MRQATTPPTTHGHTAASRLSCSAAITLVVAVATGHACGRSRVLTLAADFDADLPAATLAATGIPPLLGFLLSGCVVLALLVKETRLPDRRRRRQINSATVLVALALAALLVVVYYALPLHRFSHTLT